MKNTNESQSATNVAERNYLQSAKTAENSLNG